jgi:hypothetical protein
MGWVLMCELETPAVYSMWRNEKVSNYWEQILGTHLLSYLILYSGAW